MQETNNELENKISIVEEINKDLKDYTENLIRDIESLLKLSSRARDSGIWDPSDLKFCEVTFEQVLGLEERSNTPQNVSVVGEVSSETSQKSCQSCTL